MPTADVTILMSHYNHAKLLPRALDAILAQTVRPREIVLIDDASPDDGLAVMESYARREPTIRIVRNEMNQGVVASFNRAVKEVKTGYVGAAAADDYVLPGWIEKSMAILQAHPQAGLVCAYHSTRDESTGKISVNPSQWCTEAAYFSPERLADSIGLANIASSSAIYKTTSVVKAGGYLPDLKWYSDWFMNAVIALREGACHIPETLSLVCVKSESYSTGRELDREQHIEVIGQLLEKILLPEYADVAPLFRRSGTFATLGTDLIRAAARRPDYLQFNILSLINGFSQATYEKFLEDADPKAREIATFLLDRKWLVRSERERLAFVEHLLEMAVHDRDQARLERNQAMAARDHYQIQRDQANEEIGRMRASIFWKARSVVARSKRACMRFLGKSTAT